MNDRSPGPMFAIARRERIMEELRRTGSVTVRDLATQLGVTGITIRRDITALADRGLVTRVHGGATLRSTLDTRAARTPDASGPALYRIGMVVPSLSYYWPQIVNGARAAAAQGGVQLVLRGASYDPADQRRQIAALLESGGVHGLLVGPEVGGSDGLAILTWLDTLSVPVVLVERRAPHSAALRRLEWVSTDHEFGAMMAVNHLYEEGHRRIGIALAEDSPTAPQLRRGWERALTALGLDTEVVAVTLTDVEGAEREKRFGEIVSACRHTGTTALFVHADPQAILLEHYCTDHGIDIPSDLAIVAYDDEVAENGAPPISALRPAKEHIGRLALETLTTRLREGSHRPIQRTVVLPELKVRESSVARRG